VRKHFDLTPKGIIEKLKLRRPIYQKTAAYGHFGRSGFAWENTAIAKVLARPSEDRDQSLMRILVLGGTRFLGRCFVERASRPAMNSHCSTAGARTRSCSPDRAHPRRPRRRARATRGPHVGRGRRPVRLLPRIVGCGGERAQGFGGHYLFVSTISVYAEPLAAGLDETAPVAKLADPRSSASPARRTAG
jgi:hypothetical protein